MLFLGIVVAIRYDGGRVGISEEQELFIFDVSSVASIICRPNRHQSTASAILLDQLSWQGKAVRQTFVSPLVDLPGEAGALPLSTSAMRLDQMLSMP